MRIVLNKIIDSNKLNKKIFDYIKIGKSKTINRVDTTKPYEL